MSTEKNSVRIDSTEEQPSQQNVEFDVEPLEERIAPTTLGFEGLEDRIAPTTLGVDMLEDRIAPTTLVPRPDGN